MSALAEDDMITAGELAKLLSVSELTLKRWAARGEIPSVRLGPHTRRFSRSAIAEWLRVNSQATVHYAQQTREPHQDSP